MCHCFCWFDLIPFTLCGLMLCCSFFFVGCWARETEHRFVYCHWNIWERLHACSSIRKQWHIIFVVSKCSFNTTRETKFTIFFLRCLAKRSILSTIKSTLLPPYFILKRQIQTAFDNRKCYYAYTLADVGRLRRLQFQSHPIHWFLLFFSINISPRRCCASQRNAIFALTVVQFKTRLFHFSVFFFVSAFFSRRTTFAMNNHAHGQIAQVKAFCLSGGWIIKRIPFWSRKIAATTTELHRLKFYAKAKYRKLALTETNKRNCSNE